MSGESGSQLSDSAAEYYEQFSAPIMDEIVRWAAPNSGGRLLDVACVTGRLARSAFAAMQHKGRADGLDINAQMLEVARVEGLKTGADFSWHAASAEDMSFANDSFDFVLCSQGIMFFPDLRQGLNEMVRVAATGGPHRLLVLGRARIPEPIHGCHVPSTRGLGSRRRHRGRASVGS